MVDVKKSKPNMILIGWSCVGIIIILIIILFIIAQKIPISTDSSDNNHAINSDINQIAVTVKAQDIMDGKQKVVVGIQNNSKYVFNGNLYVKIKSNIDDSELGSDTLFVEDLLPNQYTYMIIWCIPSDSSSTEYEWPSASFKEVENSQK